MKKVASKCFPQRLGKYSIESALQDEYSLNKRIQIMFASLSVLSSLPF